MPIAILGAGFGLFGLFGLFGPPEPIRAQTAGIHFGLAHVDVMELHLERQPEGPPVARAALPAGEIERRYQLARDSGARWHRWSIYRELIERNESSDYDWSVSDGIAERDARAGLSTLAILQGPRDGFQAAIFVDAQGQPTDDPERAIEIHPANGWARFVDAAVARYMPGGSLPRARGWPAGGGIRAWEIGNEPNLASFFSGTPADYARYLEVAYLVIHRRDPAATVLHGGIGDDGNAEAWYRGFLAALAARAADTPLVQAHGYYFDKAAWHWYRTPGLLMTGPAQARALLAEAGLPAKPIWVTETGLPVWSEYPGPCWDPGSPGRATVVEQADFVWQTLGEAAASGVEVVILFQLFDDCGNGPSSYDAFGLVRNPIGWSCWLPAEGRDCWRPDPATAGQPRPAYEAFRSLAGELSGASPRAGSGRGGEGWRQLVFDRQPGTRITLAWATGRQGRRIEIPATAAIAQLSAIEADGSVSRRQLPAEGGRYRVELPGAANRNDIGGRGILDGRPIMLVEGDVLLAPSSAAAPSAGAPADAGPDRDPPLLALVEPLPEVSPPRMSLAVAAADEGSGITAWMLYVATGPDPPTDASAWRLHTGPAAWSADPKAGRIRLPFEARPGRRYHFAARAVDGAGNWSPMPSFVQATTRIASVGRNRGGGIAQGHLPY